ncbi:hypothetical protein JTB14_012478 [Gonioctena quinquepunctata]|nr:hypothetical protein JTB14_012478 [Gonioctena quinquepunctata]
MEDISRADHSRFFPGEIDLASSYLKVAYHLSKLSKDISIKKDVKISTLSIDEKCEIRESASGTTFEEPSKVNSATGKPTRWILEVIQIEETVMIGDHLYELKEFFQQEYHT